MVKPQDSSRFRKKSLKELGRMTEEGFAASDKIALSVLMEDVRSAHNVGSVFRTADCLGLDQVYLCGITAVPPHKQIHKTAIGATNSVTWTYHQDQLALARDLQSRGNLLIALEQTYESISLEEIDLRPYQAKGIVLVLGNEVDGVSQDLVDMCDLAVEIAQYGTKHSFNVSVAAGISLHHISTQLRHKDEIK